MRKYQQPQGTYLRAGDKVTASLEAQNRLRPLWPKAIVRVSPQGTATGDTSVKDGVLSIDSLLVTPPDPGSCSKAPSRTRKHGPFSHQKSQVHKDTQKTEGEAEREEHMPWPERSRQKPPQLSCGQGAQRSPSTPRACKNGEMSWEFTLAISRGLNPSGENAPASVHLCLNSQAPLLLKSLHLLLVT